MDMNFIFSWSTRYLTRSLRSLVRYRVDHEKIKFISTRGHVISSIYPTRAHGIIVKYKEVIFDLNLSVHNQNIFGSSSAIFDNLRKMFGTVRLAFTPILENLRKVVVNLRNIATKVVMYCRTFYIVKIKLHERLNIQNLS